jgi:tRNA threonylcarbamoyladenosine biosynthesis protein TsaE
VTNEVKTVESHSEQETYDLGFEMGKKAYPGQVCTLIGDLGVGKTVFTQGFAAGLGVKDYICSPTFTIVQVYDDARLPFYHFDVYRIGDESEMEEIGYEEYVYGDGVSLIEWADLISDILPDIYTRIEITKDLDKGFDFRNIKITEVG